MKTLRHAACALLAAASLIASPAYPTSFTTDESDLWYIQAESGWGMQLVQRGSVIFATLFVYDASGNPTWYVATMNYVSNFVWTGDLYATTGPYFGTVPFNPANVIATKVGTMTWTGQTVDTGNVSYTVNGVVVSKNVIRQTLVYDDFSGHYFGGIHEDITGCANLTLNRTVEVSGYVYIAQNGQAISAQTVAPGTCSFSQATLTENGQMGSTQGSFSCSNGSIGTYQFFEMQVNLSGLTVRFALNYSSPPGCQSTGWFGGLRGTTF